MGELFCSICSSKDPTLEKDGGSSPEKVQLLAKFCKKINYCEKDEDADKKLVASDGGTGEQVSVTEVTVCDPCGALVGSVMESKSSLEEEERRVRQAQRELLNLLKKMEGKVEVYQREMGRLEGLVKRKPLPQKRGKLSSEDFNQRQRVVQFRERILKVGKNLRSFSTELALKFGSSQCKPPSSQNSVKEGVPELPGLGSDPLPPSFELVEGMVKSEPSSPQPSEDIEAEPESESESDPKLSPEESDISDSDSEESTAESATSSSTEVHPKLVKTKNPIPKRKKPRSPRREPRVMRMETIHLFYPELRGSSAFTKLIICRILNHGCRPISVPLPGGYPDPRKNYSFRFDRSTRKIFVVDTEILINDGEKSLNCANCDWSCAVPDQQKKSGNGLSSRVLNHVIGKHLGGYKCPVCHRAWALFEKFRAHLRTAHVDPGCDKVPCETCGKVLKKENMWVHRKGHEMGKPTRKSHPKTAHCPKCGKTFSRRHFIERHQLKCLGPKPKSKEEPKPEPKPKRSTSTSKVKKVRTSLPLQCSTSESNFPTRKKLWFNSRTHDRSQCPGCGKFFNARWFHEVHRKECPQLVEAPGKFPCPKCDKKFNGKYGLQTHIRLTHGTEKDPLPYYLKQRLKESRVHQCDKCPKTFASRNGLLGHLKKLHTLSSVTQRPWKCGKGCGLDFAFKHHWRRHEGKCDGSGAFNQIIQMRRERRLLRENGAIIGKVKVRRENVRE